MKPIHRVPPHVFTIMMAMAMLVGVTSCSYLPDAVSFGSDSEKIEAEPRLDDTIVLDAPRMDRYARPPADPVHAGLPLTDFTAPDFVGSGKCFPCHHLLTDATGNAVSITSHWRATMMAHAAKDPLWQAKVQSEVSRNPAIGKVIEKKCATCHMPMAWTEAASAHGDIGIFGEHGFVNKSHALHQAAMDGVSCTLCHQIMDKGIGGKESFSGGFHIDTATEPPNRILYGPYKDPFTPTMERSVGFTPRYGGHTNDAALCATCHTLFTPYLDGSGNIAGEFPEQTPYLEWLNSQYAVTEEQRYDIGENPGNGVQTCQECHMPHTPPGKVVIAKYAPPEVLPKDHFSQHFFVGGNVFLLDILENNVGRLGLSASSQLLEDTKTRTLELLSGKSARLSILGGKASGGILSATVRVESLAGHKFPTGFPSRRLWIHLAAMDNNGKIFFESGKPLANGVITGNDNDENAAVYEPHHTAIADPSQVQIYETIMSDTDGMVTYTLLRAAHYLKDNRLLPRGFDKAVVAPEIGVYGGAAEDDDFTGGSDQVAYRIDTNSHVGPFTITAELLYSSVSHAFMEDLGKDAGLEKVDLFMRLARDISKMPSPVASAAVMIK